MENNEFQVQKDFTLLDFWFLLKENFLLILSVTMLFFVSLSFYAWFIATEDYISRADVMVQVEQDTPTSNDSDFDFVNAFRLIDTIAELMEKEIVLNNAIDALEEMGYERLTVEYIRDGLTVNSSSTSYFINISYIDENPLLAKDVVDKVIDAVIEETNVTNAFPVLTDKIRRTSFGTEATYNSPNKLFFSIFGVFLGATFSIVLVFIRELFSNQFKSKEEIERVLDIQVVGVIPMMNYKEINNEKKK